MRMNKTTLHPLSIHQEVTQRKKQRIQMVNCNNLTTIVVLSSLFIFFTSCVNKKQVEAQKIVSKIYEFKEANARYPNSLDEIGIKEKEEGPIYYMLTEDSANFRVWYGLNLGDSTVYQSKSGEWYGDE